MCVCGGGEALQVLVIYYIYMIHAKANELKPAVVPPT